MRLVVAFALMMLAATFVPARAELVMSSRSCVAPDVTNAYQRARYVFLGEVTEVVEPVDRKRTAPLSKQLFTIKFKVEKAWKGVFTATFEVLSGYGDRPGPFPFPEAARGQRYIVYASPLALPNGTYDPQTIMFSGCSRTALVTASETRSVIRLDETFDRMNGAADVKILDWKYPPLIF